MEKPCKCAFRCSVRAPVYVSRMYTYIYFCVMVAAALRVKFGGDRWVETCAARRASAILITSLGLIYCPFHTKGSHKFILAACAFLHEAHTHSHQNPRDSRYNHNARIGSMRHHPTRWYYLVCAKIAFKFIFPSLAMIIDGLCATHQKP